MTDIQRAAGGPGWGATPFERVARAFVLMAIVVAAVCVSALIVAGTYGILHHGDDFDFDIGNGAVGGAESDVIRLPALG